jgi:hypothetical protein
MNLCRLLALIALTVFSQQASAATDTWSWATASSGTTQWHTESGTATVEIHGNRFRAELRGADGWRHKIVGTISGKSIQARLSTNETDLQDYPLKGSYERQIWRESLADSIGRESIQLQGFGVLVGLTRELVAKPKVPPR